MKRKETIENMYEKLRIFSKSKNVVVLENELTKNIKKIKKFHKKFSNLTFSNIRQIILNNCKMQNIETSILKAIEKKRS